MLHEEIELPCELRHIERHLVGQIASRFQFGTAALQKLDEGNGLTVKRGVLGGGSSSEMGLERHIAQVFQLDDAKRIGVAEERRDRKLDALQQIGDIGERQ